MRTNRPPHSACKSVYAMLAGDYGWARLRAAGSLLQGCPRRVSGWSTDAGIAWGSVQEHSPLLSHKACPTSSSFSDSLSLIMNFRQGLNERCFIISCKVLSDSTEGFMMSLMKDPWLCKNLSWLVKSAAVGMIWVDLFLLLNSNYLQISFQGTAYRLKDRKNVTQNISVEDFPQKTNHLGF